MKKKIALLVTMGIVCTALSAGCGNSGGGAETTSDATTTTAATSEEATTTEKTTVEEDLPETLTTTGEAEEITTTASAVEATTDAPSVEPAGSVPDSWRFYGENGILTIGRNGHYQGLMGCWGTFDRCDQYITAVNKMAEKLPGVNVYSMVIPTSSQFYVPADVTGFTADQGEKISYIAAGLKGVTNVDALGALAAHTDEYIYTRTDHHWQPLGAYYAAQAFSKTAVFDFPALSDYTKVEKAGYVGSLYNYSHDENLYNDSEVFTMYISPNDASLKTTYYDTYFGNGYESDLFVSRSASSYYCSFLGSDDRIAKIETGVGNGRTLVVFKESYGNGLIPFLTSGFDKIYVCDVRYFELNGVQFCKDVGATDLLFATCTFTPAGGNCSCVSALLTQ